MKSHIRQALQHLFSNPSHLRLIPKSVELNGTEVANRAVSNCEPGDTLIYLTRSEYQDLVCRAFVSELRTYKGKTIMIISDPVNETFTSLI